MKKLIVLFASIALVLSFAATASAGEWSFYGSGRMTTFWEDNDAAAGGDADLTWAQQGNSRIGAKVKGDAVSGRFEYGTGVNMRLLYGTWNFGAGTLLVGQTYGPYNIFLSNQVWGSDEDLLGWSGQYGGRNGMLQVSFGSLKIAALAPGGRSGATGTDTASLGATDTDITVPKLEASYKFSTDLFWLQVAGGYQTYGAIGTAAGDVDVDAYVLGVGAGFNLGPANIKIGGSFGQNLDNYGIYVADGNDAASISGTTLNDTESVALIGVVTFKATDMLTLEGGVSYQDSEVDGAGGSDDGMEYYVQLVISPAPGVYIIPEVGVRDFGDSAAGADEGSMTYFGAKWQINF